MRLYRLRMILHARDEKTAKIKFKLATEIRTLKTFWEVEKQIRQKTQNTIEELNMLIVYDWLLINCGLHRMFVIKRLKFNLKYRVTGQQKCVHACSNYRCQCALMNNNSKQNAVYIKLKIQVSWTSQTSGATSTKWLNVFVHFVNQVIREWYHLKLVFIIWHLGFIV